VYELVGDAPHHHLVCRGCGQSLELSHASVASLFAAIEREHGFIIETNHLVLRGVCVACAATSLSSGPCTPAARPVTDAAPKAARRALRRPVTR
jgi:Fur family ferric uptake transcriptional regulator